MPGPAAVALARALATNGGKIGQMADAYLSFSKYSSAAKQIGQDITSALKSVSQSWIEMQDTAFKTARTMAMSREMAMRYDRMLMQSTKDLARQYGITAKEIADFQEEYGKATGRNVILTKQQIESMAALSKITDSATAAQLVDDFDKLGIGIEGSTAKIGLMQERAKALGVNATKATQALKDNIKLASSYSFKNGVNDIEKMALRATSLRMDMNAVMSAADKFMDIEGAITTSARLQMLGGSFGAQFGNPMGAMYEAMADPDAFMKRLEKTIAGKGKYDSKTGQVTFDPITMMQMREAAKQLGVSVDKLTEPAMADTQNKKIQEELQAAGKWNNWSEVEQKAIQNLSRTNVDEKTGKHYVTYVDEDGNEQRRNIEDLTKEELQIAQDRQMSEDGLFSDVQDIKDILQRTLGRARGTTSTKENLTGLSAEWDAFKAQLQNLFMPMVSGWMNGSSFQPWDLFKKISYPTGTIGFGSRGTEGFGFTNPYAFAEGGLVEPLPHAALGTIVPGDSYSGDKTPIMANAGEMVLNEREQSGLFSILKSIATTGAMMYGGNKIGKMFGMRGLGLNMGLGNLLSGGQMGIGGMLGMGAGSLIANRMMGGGIMPMGMNPMMPMGGMSRPFTFMNPTVVMNGETIMNGSIGDGTLVGQLEDIADAASEAGRATRSFSGRLRDLSKKDTFLGRRARNYRQLRVGRRALGRRISNSNIVQGIKNSEFSKLMRNLKHGTFDARMHGGGRFKYGNSIVSKADFGRKTQALLKGKGYVQEFGRDLKSLFGGGGSSVAKAGTQAVQVAGKSGKVLDALGKGAKFLGRAAGPLGTALAIGGAISDISAASSQYDAQVDEIERSGMTDMEKARAKDRAAKQKNKNIGGGVGSAVGAAAGAALGSALGPLGMMAGAWLGEKAGNFIGKGIGGLFGGSEEEKLRKQEEEKAKAIAGDNKDIIKILKSIDGKMPVASKASASFGLKPIGIESSIVDNLPFVGPMLKVLGGTIGSNQQNNKLGKTDINLNVSGTIKLEGGNKSVELDLNKLLDTPEFKRKLADIISRRLNEVSNAGKSRNETARNNTANVYNKTNVA